MIDLGSSRSILSVSQRSPVPIPAVFRQSHRALSRPADIERRDRQDGDNTDKPRAKPPDCLQLQVVI